MQVQELLFHQVLHIFGETLQYSQQGNHYNPEPGYNYMYSYV